MTSLALKQYVVVQDPEKGPIIWTKFEWETYLNVCELEKQKPVGRIITTFSPDEELQAKLYDRNENSIQGKAAIEFFQWMESSSMIHSNIPLEIKYRMFADQKNAKNEKANK